MADRKITDLTALTTPASADVLPIVDVSEAAAADKNKKITVGELFKGVPDGTAAAPAIAFESDDGNGIFLSTTDTVGIATNGSSRMTVSTTAVTSTLPVIVPDGTAAAPSVAFTGSGTDTGIYSPAANEVAISTSGTGWLFVDAAGRVGIGTANPGRGFVVDGVDDTIVAAFQSTASGCGFGLKDGTTTADNTVTLRAIGNNLVAHAGGTERARIDSSGRLLVGTSTARSRFFNNGSTSSPVQIEGNSTSTSSLSIIRNDNGADSPYLLLAKSRGTAYEVLQYVNGTSSDDAIGGISFQGADGSDFVIAAQIRCHVDGTPGANDMPGRLVFSTTADGASSPTERMRITNDGYVTNKTSGIGTVGGAGFSLSDFIITTRVDGVPAFFNRETTDGTIVSIRQDGAEEGTISVSGSTVSYNGAHLSRWSQLPSGAERTEILRGSVLSNIDEMCEWGDEDNEQLNRMKVSDVEGDKNVSGVFQAWDDDDDTYTNDFYCAMTGDFIIRIAQGVAVERGDLLMSAGDGTAKPQDDDIIRSKTIAKVTSTHVSETYADGSYCVPCVLMAC